MLLTECDAVYAGVTDDKKLLAAQQQGSSSSSGVLAKPHYVLESLGDLRRAAPLLQQQQN